METATAYIGETATISTPYRARSPARRPGVVREGFIARFDDIKAVKGRVRPGKHITSSPYGPFCTAQALLSCSRRVRGGGVYRFEILTGAVLGAFVSQSVTIGQLSSFRLFFIRQFCFFIAFSKARYSK